MIDTSEHLDFLLPAGAGLPLAGSLITGLLIGLEREIRGKPAGVRTHTLVCFAAALLTLAAARQGEWAMVLVPGQSVVSDPTRMAHGILTGIGFLGAGVIFRQGPSVQGLTTAASLWVTAALGIVFGVGLIDLALAGAAATLVVLVALSVLPRVLPSTTGVRLSVAVAPGGAMDAEELRRVLREHGLRDGPLSQSFDAATGETTYLTSTWSRRARDVDRLAVDLRGHPAVRRFDLTLAGDAGG